jgi:lactate dehydrogenase-like 2-hydroxyacid dehydrogenase
MTPEILMTAPMHPVVAEVLESRFTLHRLWDQADRAAYLAEIGPRIRGVATSTLFGRVGSELFDSLSNLEVVASFGVGYDNVDVGAAATRGIVVTNTPGVLDDDVADLTVGLLLATLRQIPQADRYLRDGRWLERAFPLSATLRGRRIGIVGLGRIGKAVARRLEGFGVEVAYHGRSRQPGVAYAYHATPVALAAASDVLIILAPGSAETSHLVDTDVLAALGPDGVLINVSRGSLVDQPALIAALQTGAILAAGLDVYADEPRVPEALIALPNTVLLPHVASASAATRAAMARLVAENLIAWFDTGKPRTSVAETAHPLTRQPIAR